MKKRLSKVTEKMAWLAALLIGILSIIWVLIRVIPKPYRIHYPCMRVAFPFATSIILYFVGIIGSVLAFRKAKVNCLRSRYLFASLFVVFGVLTILFSAIQFQQDLLASNNDFKRFEDPLGPNSPIGEAKGIFPGRVVWVHNSEATEPQCLPWHYGDGYFLDKNCDQDIVDDMLEKALLELVGIDLVQDAWDTVFKYFNQQHNKGEIGYTEGEKIFIKINAVHAWLTNIDLSIMDDDDYGNVDTSPQAILALLRQLVNNAGVPQDAIFIGDPYTQIFKHCYEKWSAEFPNVHYMSSSSVENREALKLTNSEQITYSDKGAVIKKTSDSFYDCIINADYLLNVPAIKGHRWAGVTFFAKNHFGSNTNGGASHLHKGLHRIDYNEPLREDYNMYRVFVDIMGYKHLGGKTLLYFGDLLWGTSYEHDPPVKFRTYPFNNHWSSSLLLSFDPVAIESVALDILQNEFKNRDLSAYPPRYDYVNFAAVDDYLHQAASSEWWPAGITYDPDNSGEPIASLGVHEHWNNENDKQYSVNLGTGIGIELLLYTDSDMLPSSVYDYELKDIIIYPTIVQNQITIGVKSDVGRYFNVSIFNMNGQLIEKQSVIANQKINISHFTTGSYIVNVKDELVNVSKIIIKQ